MRIYTPSNFVSIPQHAKKVFTGEIYDVYHWEQELFDGKTKTFEMLRRPDSVQIIAVHENTILICKEKQPHTNIFLDIPAGMHDCPEENELEGAMRELREETGRQFKNWKLVHAAQRSKKLDQVVYTFIATELESVEKQKLDAGESIEVLEYTFSQFQQLKYDPLARSYPAEVMEQASTLQELVDLPALHTYK